MRVLVELVDGVLLHVAAAQQPVALHWSPLDHWLGSLPQIIDGLGHHHLAVAWGGAF